ncbi:golgi-body localization protein domain-containing protein [Lipomyces tetrasporus]|uniref:Golgi-body localization protein domain-containing protein n=1 Tax=Lipomyces tetrasporus TaxID=54092 RepID=A0AAD7VWB2_9ASCO|nr:golgi-body localization protein domain-containing protein [Lipomyces tetrasporus]KAJ8103749.1 golgi-body localization protein domain-containing protein [Lipomyces tetrasporus]
MQKPEGLSLMLVELGALFCFTHLVAFVVFAFIRIFTGVSIQRLGYFSLRHISFTLKTGIQVDIRRIELNFHRPSFSRPSWITFTIADSSVYFDSDYDNHSHATSSNAPPQTPTTPSASGSADGAAEQTLEIILARATSLIYKVHKLLPYLRLIDVSIRNSSLITEDLGTIHIRSIALHADVVNRNAQLPQFFCTPSEHHDWNVDRDVAVTWRFAVKDIFYAHSKTAADQLLDIFQFDLHEIFTKKTLQPKDVSLNVRIGNLTFPYDSVSTMHERWQDRKHRLLRRGSSPFSYFVPQVSSRRNSFDEVYPQERADAAYALLDIVREVRIHAAKIGVYKFTPPRYCQTTSKGNPIFFSLATKDFTIDLRRLSSNSPGHRIYFGPSDTSHQAILTAISIVVGLDDCGSGRQDELLYVPMITMTSTTNFIRKSIQILTREETDRNSSLLKGSLTISSPSVDVHARHLPIFAAIIENSAKSSESRPKIRGRRIHIGQLLPKTIMKLSVEEPAARIIVSGSDVELIGQTRLENSGDGPEVNHLLASSCSTINCELEASHITTPTPHYGLNLSFRVTDFGTRVRGPEGVRHDLVRTETLALKVVAETSPGFDVAITGTLASFSIYLTKPEIINSLKDLLAHVRREAQRMEMNIIPRPQSFAKTRGDKNFVRQLPSWLSHVKIEGSDVMMCSSCADESSKDAQGIARGTAVQIESWILEYKPHVSVRQPSKHYRHHHGATSHTTSAAEFPHATDSESGGGPATTSLNHRRRLAVGFRGVEACVMDANDILDQTTPIFSIPDVEMAVSTYSRENCPVIEVNMLLKKMLVNYSLFHHYSLLLSTKALLQIFGRLRKSPAPLKPVPSSPPVNQMVYVDVRTHNIRLRATLPGSSPLMLETVGLDFTKRTTGIPLLRSKFLRLFVASPTVQDAWERFIVLRHFRLEFKSNHPGPTSLPSPGREEHKVREDDVVVDADALSVVIPHGLLLYQVVEGVINSMKSLKQLHHQFKTDSDTYILTPVAEEPKKLPRIRVRSKLLEMRIDDDPFESRLGLIFRVGLLEMKSRLAREAAFEAKLQALQKASTDSKETAADGANEIGERGASADPAVPEETEPLRKKGTFKSMKSVRHKHGRHKRNGTTPIRYSPTDAELPSASAKISTEAAYERLMELHSEAWIKRITKARKCGADAIESRRLRLIGPDEVETETTSQERIIAIPDSPPLFQMLFNDMNFLIDRPTYPLDSVHKFLHDVGKGLPEDTQFTLLVPFFFQLELGEARVLLRDYPLPLIHVPALNPAQGASGPSWSMSSDIVIAEEMFDSKSARRVKVPIVPALTKCDNEYSITVTRTVSAVKLYSKINVDILTSFPTRITWAPSIQPAIQQVMMVFDTFTKPPIDPSEKMGFWDKIRLIFHSRIHFSWKEGAVHLLLKGSRDPFEITRSGAGFAMCWRNNVTWDINPTGDQKEFMIVDSEEYLLTIPDFTYYVRMNNARYEAMEDDKSTFSTQSEYQDRATFQKIIMKLSGRVRWKAGVLFERDDARQRSFDFIPHYKVQLRTPQSIDQLQPHDSYARFRSNYIHLALSVISPRDKQWDAFESKHSSSSYNTIHLSPRVFTHFFEWWNLFSGEMSLPIKNGRLFSPQTVSKKFGRHLATIKYQFVLAPLFMSHMYLHKRDDNWSKMVINSIGFKGRTDSFMMDIHQRREFTTYTDKVLNVTRRRRRMRINEAEVDFHSADIRGVTVTFKERTAEELFKQLSNPNESESESPVGSMNGTPLLAKFKVSDNDLTWIDMDDYTELDSLVGSSNLSSVRVLPWLYTPRFTYYRQTEHRSETTSPAEHVSSTFGKEPSHICLLGQTDALRTQTELISARARELEEQISANTEQLEDLQKSARLYTENNVIRHKFMCAKKDAEILQYKRQTLHPLWLDLLQSMNEETKEDIMSGAGHLGENGLFADDKINSSSSHQSVQQTDNDHFSDFNNRFIFHNVHIKWTNSIRNIFLRYVHQVGQRRGLIYYMSRRAVKFLEDLVKEQQEAKKAAEMESEIVAEGAEVRDLDECEKVSPATAAQPSTREENGNHATEDMIERLLRDSKKHFVVEDEEHQDTLSTSQTSKHRANHHHVHHGQHQRRSVHLEHADDNVQDSTASVGDTLQVPMSATTNPPSGRTSTDLSGASDMVENLQREIRQLEEIRYQFQIYTSDLDEQGWRDRRNVQVELSNACDELFFIMKAITTGQRRLEDKESETTGVLQWFISGQQIIAHLLLADRTPFVDIALAKGTFRRLENSDGSNYNTIEVAMLQGINLLKGALYPELLSPYFDAMSEEDKNRKAVRVYWYMLEAIGGIPVMDHFEVDFIPLKIQLEYDIGQKLFQYIFPDEKESPFMVYDQPAVTSHEGNSTPGISIVDSNPTADVSDTSNSSSESESDAASVYSQRSQRSQLFGKSSGKKPSNGNGLSSWARHRRRTNSSTAASNARKFSLGGSMSASRDTVLKLGDNASVKSYVSAQSETRLQQSVTPIAVKNHTESNYGLDDDLSQMVTRASNFMTFVYVTIPSVVLCLSYKGRGSRNIEDVHEFVFRIPTIEYRNKTWSNLDLALRLKKDIIKALISHTGALIENKFKSRASSSKRRLQQPMIRQISDYAAFTSLADLSESNVSKIDRPSNDRVN